MRQLRTGIALPAGLCTALLLSACGGGAEAPSAAEQISSPDERESTAPAPVEVEKRSAASSTKAAASTSRTSVSDRRERTTQGESVTRPRARKAAPAGAAKQSTEAATDSGATDIGVTKDAIKLGTVSMHGAAMANLLVTPMLNGIRATLASLNDRGGILGRRVSLVDCDDGPGEVSRSKACIKKLVSQDRVFSLVGYSTWATASVHDDLHQYRLPAVGTWGYSQTEWQDPYMFPTHMSMIHEAMAGANWVKDVIKPKTYGLICLTSPEMQLACDQVRRILDASGSKLVKKLDVAISEASMSSYVLAMRAANPDHIVHYVINPATIIKFMIEAAQQRYYPPQGISGNHAATEVLGSVFGKWPAGRYWTNTTYKLWGTEFMATMNKYARANRGINHHIVQVNYAGVRFFERAARAVGPNLTRDKLRAQLNNGDLYATDASLDQRFSYAPAERRGDGWNDAYAQGREFMYKYENTNTVSNPDGSPNGLRPDPDRFVIHAR